MAQTACEIIERKAIGLAEILVDHGRLIPDQAHRGIDMYGKSYGDLADAQPLQSCPPEQGLFQIPQTPRECDGARQPDEAIPLVVVEQVVTREFLKK